MKNYILIVCAIFLFFGCTTLSGAGDSWVGSGVEDFIQVAGVPERAIKMNDGIDAYTWDLGCEFTLIAKDGVIESWNSTNCASFQPIPGKWKR